MEYLEGAQQKNIQIGRKDRDGVNLSNQGRCPAVSARDRSSKLRYPNLLVFFFLLFFDVFVVGVAFLLVVCSFCRWLVVVVRSQVGCSCIF